MTAPRTRVVPRITETGVEFESFRAEHEERFDFDPDAVPTEPGEPRPADVAPADPLTFSAQHGACVATWRRPHYVKIELDRFADSRDELSAEVVVTSIVPGLERQLAQRRVPLLGPRAVSDLAAYLAKRRQDPVVDWAEVLETAFVRAVKAHREGEPAVELENVPPRITPLYELEPLALRNMFTVAFSRPGEGKTWLLCALAVVLASGRPEILGLTPARRINVLLLDWEDDPETKAERVRGIGGGPVPGIVYLACRGAIWDELDRILRVIREHDVSYVLGDSVGMACGGIPPETSEAALRFGTAFRRIGLGGFFTAHLPHDAKDESRPFGSVFWNAQARLTWYVKSEPNADGMTLGLYNKKSNNARGASPLGFELTFGDVVRFRRRDAAIEDVSELTSKLPVKQRILVALREGGLKPAELADTLDLEERQFRARLSDLMKSGAVVRRDDRIWLAARERSG